MYNLFEFEDRKIFHDWLLKNNETSEGIWLLFGKKNGPKTLSANEALEEALCFGWIDGQMKKIDEFSYRKYFARRTSNSRWSDRNKKIAQRLEEEGLMMQQGRQKIAEAKKNGLWDVHNPILVTDEDIEALAELIKKHEIAYTNFLAMSPSVKKTYTRAYLDAKTEVGKENRLSWMIDRLNKNLKPM